MFYDQPFTVSVVVRFVFFCHLSGLTSRGAGSAGTDAVDSGGLSDQSELWSSVLNDY